MSGPQQVNLTDLDLAQLADVRKQLDEELTHLTSSFQQLKAVQAKFRNCIECVRELKGGQSKPVLVPLTNSLYVPGKITDAESVIVDVGTGYYVKKTLPQATAHYNAKITYLNTNISALEEAIAKKQENMGSLINVMQAKVQEVGAKA
ncbi:Prefoldin alpha subunit [Hymenopellis radicata]|nr:Prefoldin alpha subunit [Hymenopellis radicata]KAF9033451.1 Prefoldin alpha subunit [Hymenopellis radicata]